MLVASTGGGSDLECGTDDEEAITNAIALCEVLETEVGELEDRLEHAESVIHARDPE